jgi:integrase
VALVLATGMHRGELLALRWGNIDLEAKVFRNRESLERTKAGGLRLKAPKAKAGRRDITLPDDVIPIPRDHRRQQLEQWVA